MIISNIKFITIHNHTNRFFRYIILNVMKTRAKMMPRQERVTINTNKYNGTESSSIVTIGRSIGAFPSKVIN